MLPRMARIHRVGAPETPSEAKAIKTLAERLPADYVVVHNFEVSTGRGLPYEFDIVVVTPFALWHVEVKGYRGEIRGDERKWVLSGGAVDSEPDSPGEQEEPDPLVEARAAQPRPCETCSSTRRSSSRMTESRVRLDDDQAFRVIQLDEVLDRFTDPQRLAVDVGPSIEHLQPAICEALFHCGPVRRVQRIGLYDVRERLNQTDDRTVFLATHRYIRTRPETILRVFHIDPYASDAERARQIGAVFHGEDALRLMGTHPNVLATGDMFAWDDNKFVLPTEYIPEGTTLRQVLDDAEDRGLSWAQKTDIITGIAKGLCHAHAAGVIHRDIRPLSVVIAPGPVVKLVNFDLARIRNQPDVNEPKGLGRRLDRRYAAPEVLRDPSSADERSDVYSLGILFYELLTSRRPYEEPEAIADETPLDRALLLAELSTPGSEDFMPSPEDAADVIARMCAQDPAKRPLRLAEVVEDLTILRE